LIICHRNRFFKKEISNRKDFEERFGKRRAIKNDITIFRRADVNEASKKLNRKVFRSVNDALIRF